MGLGCWHPEGSVLNKPLLVLPETDGETGFPSCLPTLATVQGRSLSSRPQLFHLLIGQSPITKESGRDQGREVSKAFHVWALQGTVVTGVADQSQGELVGWEGVLRGQTAACVTSCGALAKPLNLSVPQCPPGTVARSKRDILDGIQIRAGAGGGPGPTGSSQA